MAEDQFEAKNLNWTRICKVPGVCHGTQHNYTHLNDTQHNVVNSNTHWGILTNMLGIIGLNVIMQNVLMSGAIFLSVNLRVMLCQVLQCWVLLCWLCNVKRCYSESHYAECRNAEYCYAECHAAPRILNFLYNLTWYILFFFFYKKFFEVKKIFEYCRMFCYGKFTAGIYEKFCLCKFFFKFKVFPDWGANLESFCPFYFIFSRFINELKGVSQVLEYFIVIILHSHWAID